MRRHLAVVLLLLWVGVAQGGAHRGAETGPAPIAEGVIVERDIVYSSGPKGALLLDLYRPAEVSAQPSPVVLYIHGGGFKYGSKENIRQYRDQDLPLDGYAVVAINYRLSGVAKHPEQLADVMAALRWIADQATAYQLDAGRVALLGYSAGGTLAALGAVTLDYEVRDGQIVLAAKKPGIPVIRAVVDYFGPIDVLAGADTPVTGGGTWSDPDTMIGDWFGFAILENPDMVATSNPINYLRADSPPFLIVHGDRDASVPLEQSRLLHQALRDVGVEAELYVIKDGEHGRGGDFETGEHQVRKRKFLARHLQGVVKP